MKEIGAILKNARIEKGYTLDDLQQTTKIQKRYLQAIEEGNTELLPGHFYARAFIKQYADIVGLNGEQLLKENLDQSAQDASEEVTENVNVPRVRRNAAKRSSFLNDFSEYLPLVLIFLLVAAIFLVIIFAWRQVNNPPETGNRMINEETTEQVEVPVSDETSDIEEENTENAEATTDESMDQSAEIVSSTGTSTTYEISGAHPNEQTLELAAVNGDSWVSITIDGSTVDQGLISSGSTLDTTFDSAVNQIDLVIGNAAVTEVVLNGTTLEYAPEAANNVRQDLILQFTE